MKNLLILGMILILSIGCSSQDESTVEKFGSTSSEGESEAVSLTSGSYDAAEKKKDGRSGNIRGGMEFLVFSSMKLMPTDDGSSQRWPISIAFFYEKPLNPDLTLSSKHHLSIVFLTKKKKAMRLLKSYVKNASQDVFSQGSVSMSCSIDNYYIDREEYWNEGTSSSLECRDQTHYTGYPYSTDLVVLGGDSPLLSLNKRKKIYNMTYKSVLILFSEKSQSDGQTIEKRFGYRCLVDKVATKKKRERIKRLTRDSHSPPTNFPVFYKNCRAPDSGGSS